MVSYILMYSISLHTAGVRMSERCKTLCFLVSNLRCGFESNFWQFYTQDRVSLWGKPISDNLSVTPCSSSSVEVQSAFSVYFAGRVGGLKASGGNHAKIWIFGTMALWIRLSTASHMLVCVLKKRTSTLNNEPLRKLGIVLHQDTQGIKLAFKVQAQWLGKQMKQLCGLWGFALKSDQDGCLLCIIPQRQLVIISISNML